MRKVLVKQAILRTLVVSLGCTAIIALILTLVQHHSMDLPHRMQYGMVFDAGSTHTSLYVYRWPGNKENNTGVVSQMLVCDVDGPGISSYSQNPPAAGNSLKACLDVVKAAIPVGQQGSTSVYLGATAGMRLLELTNQTQSEQVLQQVAKVMQGYPFDFRGSRILSGVEEGAYGWITINYLLESFIKHSFEGEWVHPTGKKILGALDMGGSSNQIAFTPVDAVRDPASVAGLKLYGNKYEVYTHSYLCYGKDQALRKLQAHLLEMSGLTKPINHSCYHLGYNTTITMGNLYDSPCVTKPSWFDPAAMITFVGASDSAQCLNDMRSIINFTNCSFAPDCSFNGVYQPPVNGDFFGFSAYFYTFDFLGLAPTAPLTKVITVIDNFCRKTWASLKTQYPNTKESFLRDYCVSAQYIRMVLVEGFKFNKTFENIYFQKQMTLGIVLVRTDLRHTLETVFALYIQCKEVANTDVGWTLGYMLNLTNLIPPDYPQMVTGVQHSQWAAAVFFIVFALFLSLLVLVSLCLNTN